jgi:catechol 2,3-dioxygenase-like lactoylglutathione lyase family enzyme
VYAAKLHHGRFTPVFAHVTIRVRGLRASGRFYRTVLGAIGVEPTYERRQIAAWDDFAIIAAEPERPVTRHLHIGFVAPTREGVDVFWEVGVDAGYEDDGPPGERPQYRPDYYGSFLRDPDGNSVEAVHHGDTRRGGNIDHLWVGVRDLDAAARFYDTVARYTGLRGGRSWEAGRQFRGPWATFSLVADGRPPTENLHIAFVAPDRQTVHDFHAAAVAAGYADNGAPGPRPQYGPDYYAAFVLDADGNNIESLWRGGRAGI